MGHQSCQQAVQHYRQGLYTKGLRIQLTRFHVTQSAAIQQAVQHCFVVSSLKLQERGDLAGCSALLHTSCRIFGHPIRDLPIRNPLRDLFAESRFACFTSLTSFGEPLSPAHREPAHKEAAHRQPAQGEPAHRQPAHGQPAHRQPALRQPAQRQQAHRQPEHR